MLDSMNGYLDWEFNKINNFGYKITLKEDYTQEQFDNLISKYGNNTSQTLGIEIKNGDKQVTVKKICLKLEKWWENGV